MQAWDKVYKQKGKFFLKPYESIPSVARFFKKRGVKRVLDLGSGTGRHIVYLTKRGFDVYGFDSSSTGVAITKKWLKKERLKAHVLVYDMKKKLPYKDGFFDAVIAVSTIHHNTPSGIKRVITEIERVLSNKGIIFFTVPKLDLKYSAIHEKPRKIGFRTYVPTVGMEKGLTHFYFTLPLIKTFFKNFTIINTTFLKEPKRRIHYNVIAVKKASKKTQN